ncbi:hypothetical protein SPRG_14740 [Saprolegnia parasitica CBS 223.65]|uniref:Secreted protein n=1 Tax=Saprolegnia parasitica (strain CBS 223.65) TaxID=695850 RepID=A0A067BZ95_SAPPC|nr:hypothetical protein SPRG_14740 [Saprolegnia parasitica CBS 223.65]KDO19897.1 hypothetical protein SPRG_14740 [Saprolegnia parasitica CBS 223.65]|eukprot:XP_012209399.1 hypothetical protein SPRG_14740 [Saprolegnia parasitica CBS 223.65]
MRATAFLLLTFVASAMACPDGHLLTSKPALCGNICPLQGGAKAQSCVYYPTSLSDFKCEQSSLGTCVNSTAETGCALKCLNNNWAVNGSYAIGIRGATGSFGRSEPIRVVQGYRAANISELILKNYNPEKYDLSLLDGAFTKSKLKSLWIENVKLSLQEHVFPPHIESLVLRNAGVRWIPKEVFGLKRLKTLEITGQYLDTTQLSADEKAFLAKVNCTFPAN